MCESYRSVRTVWGLLALVGLLAACDAADPTGPGPAEPLKLSSQRLDLTQATGVDPWVELLVQRLGGDAALDEVRGMVFAAFHGPSTGDVAPLALPPLRSFSAQVLENRPDGPEAVPLSLVLAHSKLPHERNEVSR